MERCSVKSSTVYIGQLILQLQFLCLRIDKVLSNQISTVRKQYFFDRQRIRFFLVSCLFHLIFSIQQKTNHTTRFSMKSSTIYIIQFILQLHFCFENRRHSERSNFGVAKKWFSFGIRRTRFFLIYHLICFI